MKSRFCNILFLFITIFTLLFSSCSKGSGNGSATGTDSTDSLGNPKAELPLEPQPGDSAYHFKNSQDIITYLDTSKNASKYKGGILYTIAKEVPDYADKLIPELKKYDYFIVVDKASMQVILYDKFGHVAKAYGTACAKNYGTKHKKADSRTPEGFFSVEGIYDSTNWLFTNDWGYTSPARGQFGPRFIRLKIPITRQIGIHGTASPRSIGHRVSHGCIRVTNDNILELVKYAKVGMPVIVNPGEKDRAVNRKEGFDIPYFPISEYYAMSDKEKSEPVNPVKRDFDAETKAKNASTNSEKVTGEVTDDNSSVEKVESDPVNSETLPDARPTVKPDSIK